jgi:hypothetical protein
VKVWLDQWNVRPGESLTAFMERKIKTSGHVLIVCTPAYAKKSNIRKGGVGYEQQIISGRIAAGISRKKFIPILRSGRIDEGPLCAIPTHFSGIYVLDMRTPKAYRENFEQLLRTIFNKPKFAPPAVGSTPAFDVVKRNRQPRLRRMPATRLPALELDGWELDSGVVRNQLWPKTFKIPPEDQRRNVRPGEFVKLPFEIAVPSDEDFEAIEAERMWVEVIGSEGPYFIGRLCNHPVFAKKRVLRHGSRIVFLPEHVIDIDRSEDKKTGPAAIRRKRKRSARV